MLKTKRKRIIIGTRASLLALTQSKWVGNQLRRLSPKTRIILRRIVTSGDKFRDRLLAQIGGKGLFIKEIEEALLRGEIDLAVHSLKDVPAVIPKGLCIGAIPKRESPVDVLLWNLASKYYHYPLAEEEKTGIKGNPKKILSFLPQGARIGTSSLRRGAQLLKNRGDFKIIPLRGNLSTRLRKLKENEFDAIILAQAGLNRLHLNLESIMEIPQKIMLPAIGQGALAIECRDNDEQILKLLKKLNHPKTAQCIIAERAFLSSLGAGCQFPIAGLSEIHQGKLIMEGLIISPDGNKCVRGRITGKPQNAEILGSKLGKRLLSQGGRKILSELN